MYSIIGLETVFDVMAYTVKAMDDSGFMPGEIEDYITEAIKDNNFNLIEISKEYLEKCNEVVSANSHCEFEDTWRDHYYSSLWEDDLDSNCNQWDDDGRYDDDFLNGNKHWDNGNIIDDVQTVEEEKEAYEGFSTCKNYYWDSSEDENGIDAEDLATAEEFKPSYDDIVYDPWAEEDTK